MGLTRQQESDNVQFRTSNPASVPLALLRSGGKGLDRVLVELPTHHQCRMIIGREDRVDSVFLLLGQESNPGADCIADSIEIVTRSAPAPMKLCLESAPRFIKICPDESDDMEGAHDRDRVWDHFDCGFLIAGEGVHGDVINTGSELIGLVVQPLREHLGRAAGNNVEEPCWPVAEVDNDGDTPVDSAVGPTVLIATDRGYTIEPGGIGEQQRRAEVEDSRTHGVPGGGEVLRDHMDTHLVEDNELQRPAQACAGDRDQRW